MANERISDVKKIVQGSAMGGFGGFNGLFFVSGIATRNRDSQETCYQI